MEQRTSLTAHRRHFNRQRATADEAKKNAAGAELEDEVAKAKARQQISAFEAAKSQAEAAAAAATSRLLPPVLPSIRITILPPAPSPVRSVVSSSSTLLSSSVTTVQTSKVIPTSISKTPVPRQSTMRAISTSAAPSATPTSSSGSNISTGAMVGGIAGGLAAVALLSFAVVFFMRRKNRKNENLAFQASAFRRSAILLDDPKSSGDPFNQGYQPRPPATMIERPVVHTTTTPGTPQYNIQQFNQQPVAYNESGQVAPSRYVGDANGHEPYGYQYSQAQPASEQHRQYGLAPGFKYPHAPSHNPSLPGDTAALVAAAAYGPRPPSPEATYTTTYPSQSESRPVSVLPNPYGDAQNDDAFLNRRFSPPPPIPSREEATPSPIFGINGQYVDMTRESHVAPPDKPLPPATNRNPAARMLVIQNPSENELPLPPKNATDDKRVGVRTPVNSNNEAPGKRPDTVFSTIYNPDDVYGGI